MLICREVILNLKKILKDLTKDGRYYAEIADTIAEIYLVGEPAPVALLEVIKNVCHINFRRDLSPQIVSQLTYDLTVLNSNIVADADFMISDTEGYLYGNDAAGLYFTSIYRILEHAKLKEEANLNGAFFVVQEPIFAYTKNDKRINKNKKLWGDY